MSEPVIPTHTKRLQRVTITYGQPGERLYLTVTVRAGDDDAAVMQANKRARRAGLDPAECTVEVAPRQGVPPRP